MKLRFRLPFFLSVLIVSSFAWLGVSGAGNTAFAFELKADPVLWDRLSYRAKSIFGNVTTDVRLKSVNVEDGAELFITDPAGEALQPTGTTLFKLTVDSNINPLFGAAEIFKTQSWFEPGGAAALQRIRLRLGQDKWQKSYRFTKKGVFRLRKKPKDSGEENLPIDQWTKIRNHFYGYGDKDPSCPHILEPASLLYISSAFNLPKAPKSLSLCVFNKKQLHRVTVSVSGSRLLKVNFLEKRGDGLKRVAKKIDTIKISFQPRSLASTNIEPEEFSFMGLKGDFDIYIDKASRVPVQISGKISAFGKVDIR
jgi:hypothetical protein